MARENATKNSEETPVTPEQIRDIIVDAFRDETFVWPPETWALVAANEIFELISSPKIDEVTWNVDCPIDNHQENCGFCDGTGKVKVTLSQSSAPGQNCSNNSTSPSAEGEISEKISTALAEVWNAVTPENPADSFLKEILQRRGSPALHCPTCDCDKDHDEHCEGTMCWCKNRRNSSSRPSRVLMADDIVCGKGLTTQKYHDLLSQHSTPDEENENTRRECLQRDENSPPLFSQPSGKTSAGLSLSAHDAEGENSLADAGELETDILKETPKHAPRKGEEERHYTYNFNRPRKGGRIDL